MAEQLNSYIPFVTYLNPFICVEFNSNAKPKIADYAFTTVVPNLGMLKSVEHPYWMYTIMHL
jgi:hypothetical protein